MLDSFPTSPVIFHLVRKLALATLVLLCVLTGVPALVGTPPADAYLKHEYVSQIDETPENTFSDVCGATVDPASQDLYVADFGGDDAINIFDSSGIYQSSIEGSSVPEGSFNPVKFEGHCQIAVSDVTGDVYLADDADPSTSVVYVFGALGNYLETINGSTTPSGTFLQPGGDHGGVQVAVDQSSGEVYIASKYYGVVDRFNKENEYQSQLPGLSKPGAMAVSSNGDLYVGVAEGVREFSPAGTEIGHIVTLIPSGIAVDSEGNVYVVGQQTSIGVMDEYSSSGVVEAELTSTPTGHLEFPSGVAVSAVGNVYVTSAVGSLYVRSGSHVNIFGPGELVPDVTVGVPSRQTSTTATLEGTVNPDGTNISSCKFEYGPTPAYGQTVQCEAMPAGSSPVAVSAYLSGLEAGTEYHYRLVVTNANGFNASEDHTMVALGARIGEESFSSVGKHSAIVAARIDGGGLPTVYDVEYGTSEAYGSTTPKTSIGAGSGAREISATIGGSGEGLLQPDTTYHFRIVATNEDGTTRDPDVSFTTLSGLVGLPDDRGYELVSPLANANGNVYVPGSSELECGICTGSALRASADGDAVEYAAEALATGGTGLNGSLGGSNEFVATRDAEGGWSPFDLSTPGFDAAPFEALFASELSNTGTSGVPAGTHRLEAIRDALTGEESLADSVGGRPLPVSVLPDGVAVPDASFGSSQGDLSHVISADGSRIFWTDLTEGPDKDHIFMRMNDERTVAVSLGAAEYQTASADGRYVFYTEFGDIYRFDVETEERVGLVPASYGATGTGDLSYATGTGAIVTEGSNIITGISTTGGTFAVGQHVLLSKCINDEDGFSESRNLGAITAILSATEIEVEAMFHSCKGGILTAESAEITSVATATGRFLVGESIYGPGIPAGTRITERRGGRLGLSTDVTAPGANVSIASGGPEALGVIGVNETGEDGAYVYFVANSVLGDGAEHGAMSGNCQVSEPHEGEANCIYVLHDGVTKFIAALAPQDLEQEAVDPAGSSAGKGGDLMASLGFRTAELAADGHALVFNSYASLTGYANNGKVEAYVYDANTGRLSCVSCNPTGTPAVSTLATNYRPLRPSGNGTFMDRLISEDGTRVFFESAEGLVGQDTNGKDDVYEWEQDKVGSCQDTKGCVYLLSGGSSIDNSYLLGASANGDDVFMISRAQLVPQDQGETYEVYDARVGVEQPVGTAECAGTGCQGLPSAPPLFATPSSVTFGGVGNFPPSQPPTTATKRTTAEKAEKCPKGEKREHGNCNKPKSRKKSKTGKASKDRRASR